MDSSDLEMSGLQLNLNVSEWHGILIESNARIRELTAEIDALKLKPNELKMEIENTNENKDTHKWKCKAIAFEASSKEWEKKFHLQSKQNHRLSNQLKALQKSNEKTP